MCLQRGYDHHIFYKESFFNSWNIYVRAHEETHVLEHLEHLDLLEKRLLDEQNVKINFNQIEDSEVKGDLGSIYALNKNRISMWRLGPLWLEASLIKANSIYKTSKVK